MPNSQNKLFDNVQRKSAYGAVVAKKRVKSELARVNQYFYLLDHYNLIKKIKLIKRFIRGCY